MSPGFPPGPLEALYLPLVIGVVVGLGIRWEARRREKTSPWLKGLGFALIALAVSGFDPWWAIPLSSRLSTALVLGSVLIGLLALVAYVWRNRTASAEATG